jgi:hypothetical protein
MGVQHIQLKQGNIRIKKTISIDKGGIQAEFGMALVDDFDLDGDFYETFYSAS